MTIKYSISSIEEAAEYLRHATLGTRLLECSQLATGHTDRTLKRILAATDSVKFWSSIWFTTGSPTYLLEEVFSAGNYNRQVPLVGFSPRSLNGS